MKNVFFFLTSEKEVRRNDFQKEFQKVRMAYLVSALVAGLFYVPAFGQSLTGEYKMVGRRCEDSRKLAPPTGDAQTMFFGEDGSFRHTFFQADNPFPEGLETYQERRRERRIDEFLEFLEEDKQNHKSACKEHGKGVIFEGDKDLCEPENERELFAKWRRDRIASAEAELEKEEEEDRRLMEEAGECSMRLEGRFSSQGNRMTVLPEEFLASEDCGDDRSYPPRRSIRYYFEDRFLLFVHSPMRDSREYCGSSDWAEIWIRQ